MIPILRLRCQTTHSTARQHQGWGTTSPIWGRPLGDVLRSLQIIQVAGQTQLRDLGGVMLRRSCTLVDRL